MKRSLQVRLVLLGGVASAILPGCARTTDDRFPAAAPVFANNDHPEGYGYYHAPYRGWYTKPYNYKDHVTGLYFHGGNWTKEPHLSIINVSEPRPEELKAAQAHVTRSGFGGTGSHHYFSS